MLAAVSLTASTFAQSTIHVDGPAESWFDPYRVYAPDTPAGNYTILGHGSFDIPTTEEIESEHFYYLQIGTGKAWVHQAWTSPATQPTAAPARQVATQPPSSVINYDIPQGKYGRFALYFSPPADQVQPYYSWLLILNNGANTATCGPSTDRTWSYYTGSFFPLDHYATYQAGRLTLDTDVYGFQGTGYKDDDAIYC